MKRPAASPAISGGDSVLTVDEALATIIGAAAKPFVEKRNVETANGFVVARDIASKINHPPFRASAMDGYAVRFSDAEVGAKLLVVGEAAAGAPFAGAVGAGEAVRIFTGGVVPEGADHVAIQEEVTRDGDVIIIDEVQKNPSNIREAAVDFREGEILRSKGDRLVAMDLALLASANIAEIDVFQKPLIAYFDNGDELREPGSNLRPGEIVGSNRFALDAMIAEWGGVPKYLGRAEDDLAAIGQKFREGKTADILVTVGGASVGDRDYVRSVFAAEGGELAFPKIAVRPGKPTWFGRIGNTRVLGLPGNPASAIVCAILFLRPLVKATGGERFTKQIVRAALAASLGPNGPRETYLRGRVRPDDNGRLIAEAAHNQDSSLLSPLAAGNCLIRRFAHASAAAEGELADCLVYGNIGA